MKIEWKREWAPLTLLAAMFVGTMLVFERLPDPMPIHWNAAGEADNYAGRWLGAFLMPLIGLGVYGMLLVVPKIDPRRENYARFAGTYRWLRLLIVLFLGFVHAATLYSVVAGDSRLNPELVLVGMGLLFLLLGNMLPRVRSNWFVGIRTPWTLSNDEVWRRTHRVGGRAFFVAGFAMMAGAVLPSQWMVWLILGAALLAAGVPVVYSYLAYRQLEQGA